VVQEGKEEEDERVGSIIDTIVHGKRKNTEFVSEQPTNFASASPALIGLHYCYC